MRARPRVIFVELCPSREREICCKSRRLFLWFLFEFRSSAQSHAGAIRHNLVEAPLLKYWQ